MSGSRTDHLDGAERARFEELGRLIADLERKLTDARRERRLLDHRQRARARYREKNGREDAARRRQARMSLSEAAALNGAYSAQRRDYISSIGLPPTAGRRISS